MWDLKDKFNLKYDEKIKRSDNHENSRLDKESDRDKEFHSKVLSAGNMPMSLLGEYILN